MAFLNWFHKFCLERGLGEVAPELELWAASDAAVGSRGAGGAGGAGGADKAALVKEVVIGEGDDEITVRFAVEARSESMLLSLACKVASMPFNPFRKQAFLQQRLRLNAPHETGLCGYLALRDSEIFFVRYWCEQRQSGISPGGISPGGISPGGISQGQASSLLDSFLARARRFKRIFYQFTREQLRTAHEEDILALEHERGSSEKTRLATFKL